MKNFFLALHIVSMCLVIGTLFLQSLTVVFRLRLKNSDEVQGVKKVQGRVHKFIYYPILATTIFSGIYLTIRTGLFQKGENWIYWKLSLLIILIFLGIMNGKQIMKDILTKKYAMMVHIAIFIIGVWMIYLATIKPF